MFMEIIHKAMGKYNFELSGYTIMDNHFHLIIKTKKNEATISRIMQYIKARFAEKYNKINNRTGAFWNERFSDTIIENSRNPATYLLWLLWYIAFNAVKVKKSNIPEEYYFSSIKAYLSDNYISNVKITLHEFFIELGENLSERLKIFNIYRDEYKKYLDYINH